MSQPRAFVSRMMHPDAIAVIGESHRYGGVAR